MPDFLKRRALLLPSAARTAAPTTVLHTNNRCNGLMIALDVTAASGTGGLTLACGLRSASGVKVALLTAAAAVIATGTRLYIIWPLGSTTITGGITQITSAPVPGDIYIDVAHGDGSSYTYSITIDET